LIWSAFPPHPFAWEVSYMAWCLEFYCPLSVGFGGLLLFLEVAPVFIFLCDPSHIQPKCIPVTWPVFLFLLFLSFSKLSAQTINPAQFGLGHPTPSWLHWPTLSIFPWASTPSPQPSSPPRPAYLSSLVVFFAPARAGWSRSRILVLRWSYEL
jgi:hypothetical protein